MTDENPGPGDQHDAKGAHVQVLTAEVRTLVVGSRQVTMSVYNQHSRTNSGEPLSRPVPSSQRPAPGRTIEDTQRGAKHGRLR